LPLAGSWLSINSTKIGANKSTVAGFVFLDLASSFKPTERLMKFLDGGDPPVYIGFGSVVVDDPDKFTKTIFEAVKKAGVRALVSKGWGGLVRLILILKCYPFIKEPGAWELPEKPA
jgi:hypothetical protein